MTHDRQEAHDEREPEHLELEELLSDALRPIEPPEDLASRVESTLTAITEQAAAELSSWAEELSEGELDALRDPATGCGPRRRGGRGHARRVERCWSSGMRRRRTAGPRDGAESRRRERFPSRGVAG